MGQIRFQSTLPHGERRLTIALALAESREALSEDQARVIKDLLMPKSA